MSLALIRKSSSNIRAIRSAIGVFNGNRRMLTSIRNLYSPTTALITRGREVPENSAITRVWLAVKDFYYCAIKPPEGSLIVNQADNLKYEFKIKGEVLNGTIEADIIDNEELAVSYLQWVGSDIFPFVYRNVLPHGDYNTAVIKSWYDQDTQTFFVEVTELQRC